MSEKRRVMLIGDRWAGNVPGNSPALSLQFIEAPLLRNKDIESLVIRYDEWSQKSSRPIDLEAYAQASRFKPDLILVVYPMSPVALTGTGVELLKRCAPTVMLHTDAISYPDADHSVFAPFYTAPDRHVSYDNPLPKALWEGTSMDHTKWSWVPTPSDPDIFCDPGLERTIPISHVGTLKQERIAVVKTLADNGIDTYCEGGYLDRNPWISYEAYAKILQTSKVSIAIGELTDESGGTSATYGRMFEIPRCGAMILANETLALNAVYEPYVHYVPFKGHKDLVDKTRYYIENDAERSQIAVQGHRLVTEKYGEDNLWKHLLGLADDIRSLGRSR